VVASGVVDGGAGTGDNLDLSEYSTDRNVTLGASDADGFDGTEASVSSGFSNINNIQASASASGDALTGADTAAIWQVVGDTDNVYSSNGDDLGFENFEVLNGGADVDTFQLGGGSQTGNLSIDGMSGSDTVDVVAAFEVIGDLSITDVETVTNSGGASAVLSANLLRIIGASGGIGSSGAALQTNVDGVDISGAGDVYLIEAGSLNTVGIGSIGDVSVQTGTNMVLALVSADGEVTLVTLAGNIINGNGDADPNSPEIRGSTVTLVATEGLVGSDSSPITIDAPKKAEPTIFVTALGGKILNPNLARVQTNVADLDATEAGVSAAVGASVLSALEKIGFIDWAGLNPDVKLVDCLDPCIKLPPDQLEDEELAGVSEPTQMLVIRTIDGIKLIPVFVQQIAQTSQEVGETDHDGPVLN
jgi:hypothetical protein